MFSLLSESMDSKIHKSSYPSVLLIRLSIKEVSNYGNNYLNSLITCYTGNGMSHAHPKDSLILGSIITSMSLKFGWSLNNKYAVCKALLKGETIINFKFGRKISFSLH